jgi:transposase
MAGWSASCRSSMSGDALREFLQRCDAGSPVAVETTGSRYWIVDEIEGAGCAPRLVHAHKAQLMLGMINKTDKLDARGLNRLQRTGTLPTVWIPSSDLRDWRDLPRTRMVLVRQRTRLKNRMHAVLAKYAVSLPDVSDLFGRHGTRWLREQLGAQVPPQPAYAARRVLEQIDTLDRQVVQLEARMDQLFTPTPELELLRTLPGVGLILGIVMLLEVGDVPAFRAAPSWPPMPGPPRGSTPAAARRGMGPSDPTSTATSSGRSWKPPTSSAAAGRARRTGM